MLTGRPSRLDALRRTMREWRTPQRAMAVSVAVVLTSAFSAYFAYQMGDVFAMSDGEYYLAIARGDTASSSQPFASRQLGALVVRAMVALFHVTVNQGFVIEAAVCMFAAIVWVFGSMSRTEGPRWVMAVSILLPFWRITAHGTVLPDVWYLAMLCVFLALLEAGQVMAAAAFLLPLMVSRESTSMVLVCFLLACWKRLGWRGSALAVAATAAGSLLVGRLTAEVKNVEHLPQSVYLLAKVPWNALRLTGIHPWSNLYPVCEVRRWEHPLHIGPLHAIGICGYDWDAPLACALFGMTTFGLMPALAFFLLRARRWRLGGLPVLRFAVIYGTVSFVMAPLLGTAYDRLFSYAWPLTVVAAPRLWADAEGRAGRLAAAMSPGAVAVFFALHTMLCLLGIFPWLPPGANVAAQAVVFALGCGLLARRFRGVRGTA